MAIRKREISLETIKGKYSTKTKYKPESFYNLGEAFLGSSGLPGPIMGGINMFLGHSNTSKTTAMILAAADAQKKGHLPILIITEKKWSWEHAIELGLQVEKKELGDYDTTIAGAIGEVYAEVKLGLRKAPRGTKGIDGWINERGVSIKTKD